MDCTILCVMGGRIDEGCIIAASELMKHVQRATGVLDRGGVVGLPSWPEFWEEQ